MVQRPRSAQQAPVRKLSFEDACRYWKNFEIVHSADYCLYEGIMASRRQLPAILKCNLCYKAGNYRKAWLSTNYYHPLRRHVLTDCELYNLPMPDDDDFGESDDDHDDPPQMECNSLEYSLGLSGFCAGVAPEVVARVLSCVAPHLSARPVPVAERALVTCEAVRNSLESFQQLGAEWIRRLVSCDCMFSLQIDCGSTSDLHAVVMRVNVLERRMYAAPMLLKRVDEDALSSSLLWRMVQQAIRAFGGCPDKLCAVLRNVPPPVSYSHVDITKLAAAAKLVRSCLSRTRVEQCRAKPSACSERLVGTESIFRAIRSSEPPGVALLCRGQYRIACIERAAGAECWQTTTAGRFSKLLGEVLCSSPRVTETLAASSEVVLEGIERTRSSLLHHVKSLLARLGVIPEESLFSRAAVILTAAKGTCFEHIVQRYMGDITCETSEERCIALITSLGNFSDVLRLPVATIDDGVLREHGWRAPLYESYRTILVHFDVLSRWVRNNCALTGGNEESAASELRRLVNDNETEIVQQLTALFDVFDSPSSFVTHLANGSIHSWEVCDAEHFVTSRLDTILKRGDIPSYQRALILTLRREWQEYLPEGHGNDVFACCRLFSPHVVKQSDSSTLIPADEIRKIARLSRFPTKEWDKYIDIAQRSLPDDEVPPLQWWRQKRRRLPLLCPIALSFLLLPVVGSCGSQMLVEEKIATAIENAQGDFASAAAALQWEANGDWLERECDDESAEGSAPQCAATEEQEDSS